MAPALIMYMVRLSICAIPLSIECGYQREDKELVIMIAVIAPVNPFVSRQGRPVGSPSTITFKRPSAGNDCTLRRLG